MSKASKSIINDYISKKLTAKGLEQSLTKIFGIAPDSDTVARDYLESLLSSERVTLTHFTEISEIISKANIQSTLNNGSNTNDEEEDKTLHFPSDPETPENDSHDKTAILNNDNIQSVSKDNTQSQTTNISPKSPQKSTFNNQPSTDGSKQPQRDLVLGTGTILKGRFVLLEKLGQGGMGVVYKAKDMVKVEAQDKSPYVAIKVLTDAFKKYSGSFIALQREASKAQRLAHPNIATVYDFDKDWNTVFMTMEYLQGKPLNQVIKEIAEHPLKTEQALDIIDKLCSGLAYAHEKQLIHSDFKPGNCFLLNDGQVKLLDFGIARASTQKGGETDNTMFDPVKLSAVTPAYATLEMFAGMSSDPRDDIYGLGCVAYQLLADGKHPYNKVSLQKIKELGIKPKPIKGLTRKQQRTLLKALAVKREDRIATVEKFAEGMRLKKTYTKKILLIILFILLLITGVGYKQGYEKLLNFRTEQALYDKIQLIKQGDKALLIETIWSMDQLKPEEQQIISVRLRREIITFYRDRVRSVFRPNDGLYDYPQAINLLQQARKHYPDSVAVSTIEDQIKEQKDRLMNSLVSLYNRYLNSNQLIKSNNGEDLTTVIPLIKRIDPEHYLLKDRQLNDLYLSEAEKHLSNREFKDASNYITTGLEFFPDDIRLQNLAKQINK